MLEPSGLFFWNLCGKDFFFYRPFAIKRFGKRNRKHNTPILQLYKKSKQWQTYITELSGLGKVGVGHNWDRKLMLMNGSLQTNARA